MNAEWSLDAVYRGLEDPAYEADVAAAERCVQELKRLSAAAEEKGQKERTEELLLALEAYAERIYKLDTYLALRQAVNTEDGDILAQIGRIRQIMASEASADAAILKMLADIEDIDALAEQSEIIKAYRFMLKENKENAKHLLSDDAEEMIASMNINGGAAWSGLFDYLTSTVAVVYDGGEVTLSEIRNLAYSPNATVRKAAYEAELKAYEKIEGPLAFALNHIKGQVRMLCQKRGYESPLQMTLMQSRMSRETLDAMMEAIREYLPIFRKYLRKKGTLLGYNNGLPWYELFAPLGRSDKTFLLEEARDYLIRTFHDFTPDMADMMKEAFENEWIDFYPKKGKQGGAFCAMVPCLKQSRILTNYDGYFASLDTLAHELGHAFHNRQLENERPMNQNYPMPVAETASTLNEIHLLRAALKTAEGAERLNLLESDLKEQTQCIVDIYSRYLFETAVFEEGENRFLMAADCRELMKKAQKEAYGDGLDPEYLHPYMWACKGHYYSEALSFYNFPYAFGNLFALGLYSRYLAEGEPFVQKYKAMLKATPCCTIEEAGAMMGIDLTKPDFWRESLSHIAETVEEFCNV